MANRLTTWWAAHKQRLQDHFAEYGLIAVATYLVIFFGTLAAFVFAIGRGVAVEGVAAGSGTLGAAYVATKVTQPVRIIVTLAVTPFVAAAWHRLRGRPVAPVAVTKSGDQPPPG